MAKYGYRWEVFKMYGIEQKLKITRHTERYGTASCCDAFDVKARDAKALATALSGRGGDGLIRRLERR